MATATFLDKFEHGWGTDIATATSNSINPGADCALVFIVGGTGDYPTAGGMFESGTATVTSSGSGPTWTRQSSSSPAGTFIAHGGVFTATIGGTNPGAFTVTITIASPRNAAGQLVFGIYKVTGHDTTTPFAGAVTTNAGAGNGAVSVTLGATPVSGDIVFALTVADGGGASDAVFDNTARTWTRDATGGTSGQQLIYAIGQSTGSTSTTVAWSDVNEDTTDNFSSGQAAIIVKAAAAGSSAAITLDPFTTSASGTVQNPVSGTAAVTLGSFTASSSGTVTPPNNVVYVKEVGAVTNTTSATTATMSVATGGVPVGDVVVVLGSADNMGASGAASTVTVTDTRSNTWTTLSPQAIADPGTTAAGIQGFIAWTKVSTAMLAADTITVTFGAATAAKAINAQQFTNAHAGTPILAGSYTTQDNQTSTTNSVSATPAASGSAVIALVAVEGGTADSYTEDSDTTGGSWVTLTRRGSGTTTSGATLNSAYKIVTSTAAQTYDPTLGTARDHAAAIVVLNVNHSGSAAVTLGTFTASASGTISTPNTGTAAVTLGTFTPAASGAYTAPPVTGTSARTLGTFVAAASGTYTPPPITGTAAVTLGTFVAVGLQVSGVPTPTTISGRKLLDQYGNPIQIRTFSSWGMGMILSNANITSALEKAHGRGFNSVTVVMDGGNDYGSGWSKFHNASSTQLFYTGTAYQSTLGAAWATHIGWLLDEANRLGMFVLASIYPGRGTNGSQAEIDAATNAQMLTTGQRWATFLAPWSNWILHVGADAYWAAADTTGQRIENFAQGIKSVKANVIIVAEPDPARDALDQWPPADFTYFKPIQAMYQYSASSVASFESTYAGTTGPTWDCEPPYLGAGHYSADTPGAPTAGERQNLRERHYTVPIEGGVGLNNGSEDWWHFTADGFWSAGDTWDTVMDNTVVVQWQYGWAIWDYCNTTAWAPTSSFVTTGEGTGDTKAAIGTDVNVAIAYFPSSRTTVVDTTILTGTANVRLRWYDPTAGTYSTIAASEAQNASRSVTFPSNHADGTSDFVLVAEVLLPIGTAAVTLGSFTTSASGQVGQTGTSARTLGTFTAAASGTVVAFVGTAARTLGTFTAAASGTVTPPGTTGTAAVTLGTFTSSASGTTTPPAFTGTVAVTLGSFVTSASGTSTPPAFTGTAAVTLGSFTVSSTGTVTPPAFTGTAAVTLGAFTTSASGTFAPAGSGFAAVTLGTFTTSATGQVGQVGTSSQTLGTFTAAASGTYTPPPITGTAARTLGAFTTTASGTSSPPGNAGTAAVTLAVFTVAASGTVVPPGVTGTSARTLGTFTAVGSGTFTPQAIVGTAAITLGTFVAVGIQTVLTIIGPRTLTRVDLERTLTRVDPVRSLEKHGD